MLLINRHLSRCAPIRILDFCTRCGTHILKVRFSKWIFRSILTHPTGRVLLSDSNRLQYKLVDHLGNTVVFFEDKNGDGTITSELLATHPDSIEVLDRTFYSPFGLPFEGTWLDSTSPEMNYTYNGKEKVSAGGLDWLDYGARWYMPTIGRFSGVDPISDQFPHVTTYNYAENEPIAHIDLWGLQKVVAELEVINKAKHQNDAFSTYMGMLTNVGTEIIDYLEKGGESGLGDLSRGLGQLNFFIVTGNIASDYNSVNWDDPDEITEFNERMAATGIGETISLFNPILGMSVGGILMDGAREDGLTNLDNGKLAKAYSQNYTQSVEGNFHMKRIQENQAVEPSSKPIYELRKYAEIDVFVDIGSTTVKSRKRFYPGSFMYRVLTGENNAPDAPGHNPSTTFGIEIIETKTD